MEFRDSYRMEAIYFQTLKEEINRVKNLMASGNTEQAKTLLENAVNVDGAVLLLYRNLGELWGELGAKIEEVKKELEKLDNRVSDNLRELNEKIDDVNNTIIRLIRALEERVKALEDCCEEVREELAKLDNLFILTVVRTTDPDSGDPVYTPSVSYSDCYNALLEGKMLLGILQYHEEGYDDFRLLYPSTAYTEEAITFYDGQNRYSRNATNDASFVRYFVYEFDVDNSFYEHYNQFDFIDYQTGVLVNVTGTTYELSETASNIFDKRAKGVYTVITVRSGITITHQITEPIVKFEKELVNGVYNYTFVTNLRTYTAIGDDSRPTSAI